MATDDDSDIPDIGAVFTFGKSKFADNLPSKFWVKNDKVLHVSCGDEHTAIVNETGRVFTFGSNDWGQLGLDHTKTIYKPTCVKKLKQEKSVLVACGRVHTLVATESGKLFSFGANSEGQLGIENCSSSNEPKEITAISTHTYKQLSAGADHSAALTEDGEVYVWGGGSEGQLGLGDEMECPQPQLLDIEGKVTCLSCGYYHTALVTESGDLYTFGESDGGKLGLGDVDIKAFTPTKVDLPEKVISVACGNSHTVALLESGKVFSFGDGSNGQLGHGTRVLQSFSPKQIHCKQKIKQLACGDSHTALITVKDRLLTFGDGRHGKLGQDQESYCNLYVPTLIERFNNFHIDQVSCGGCHMLAVGHKRLQTEDEESSEEETEEVSEVVNKNLLNASLKADGSLDLNNSFTAREKRRQNTLSKSPSIVKRQLPELNNNNQPPLSSTMPPNETPLAKERIHGVQNEDKIELHRTAATKGKSKHDDDDSGAESEEEEEETDKHVHETIEKVKVNGVQSMPRPMPRPPPRRPIADVKETAVKKAEKSEESEKESEEEEEEKPTPTETAVKKAEKTEESEEEEEKPTPTKPTESKIAKPEESEKEEESEEETQSKPTPTKRALPKKQEQSDESEEEIKATTSTTLRDLPRVPVPQPRKGKQEKDEEEESEEEEKEEKKKKGKKKQKKSKAKIFGKSTGLSDDDDDDEDEEEEDEDQKKKEEKDDEDEDEEKDKKKKDKKKGKEDKKGKKDKKKDKKDKDKKKGKKGKKDEEDEEKDDEEENSETEEKDKDKKGKKKNKDKKDKKKDKKDKKKDKDEDDEDEEETDKKKKGKEKDKKDKKDKKDDNDTEKDEEENKEDEEGKKDEKKEEAKPQKKKSSLCTIL